MSRRTSKSRPAALQEVVVVENRTRDRSRGNGLGSLVFDEKTRTWKWSLTLGFRVLSNGKKKQLRIYGSHKVKTEAERQLARAVADRDRGLISPPDRITVAEYAASWLAALKVSDGSRLIYGRELQYALDVIGPMKVREVKPGHVKTLMSDLASKVMQGGVRKQRPMSARTQGKVLTHLKAMFREAVLEQVIYFNPADGVKKAKLETSHDEEPVGTVFDQDQFVRFIEVGQGLERAGLCRAFPMLFTSLNVGLRKGEVMGLRWEDVDFERNLLHVRQNRTTSTGKAVIGPPKTKASRRSIPMPSSLRRVLTAVREAQESNRLEAGDDWVSSGAVFATLGGEWMLASEVTTALNAVIAWSDPHTFTERAKHLSKVVRSSAAFAELERVVQRGNLLPNLRVHDLRHTYATLALRNRVPVEVVSKTLGHAKISITMDIYRHVLLAEQREHSIDLVEVISPALSQPVQVRPVH